VNRCFNILLIAWIGSELIAAEPSSRQAIEFFEKKIRPVLVDHCYECHSVDAAKAGKLKGGLQLDTRAGVLQGGDSGPAVVSVKVDESLLLNALRYDELEMPPKGRLSDSIIADFEKWIEDGAVDPRDGEAILHNTSIDFDKARQFWSYRPPSNPTVRENNNSEWPRNDIDRFVLAKLESHGIQPIGDADDRTLIRRLYFDLIGLPPSPDEIQRFLSESASDRDTAVAALVWQLLDSQHFGERWGRHWLDVVRFAESNGRDVNVVWYHASRYRDWVIDALNNDKPFNTFVREQIAGDLLPASSNEQYDQQRIATGLLAMSPKMIGERNPAIFQMDMIDEQIEVISRAFLGLSVSCARCHDHKFDPIPTQDYYALAGILKSTETLYGFGRPGVANSPHTDLIPIGEEADNLGPVALDFRKRLVKQHETFQKARSDRYRVVRRVADAKVQMSKPGADHAEFKQKIARMEAEIKEWDAKVEALQAELKELIDNAPPQPGWAMGVRNRGKPIDCRVHIRGETTNLGEPVPRGVLQAVSISSLPDIDGEASGRRYLADWLADDENPLTPRVAVNRVWMHLFGRGLVATVDDFGATGSAPSHPELLDHLTRRFIDNGWSIKELIRWIVLSRTYQLASSTSQQSGFQLPHSADPENVLLWRHRPNRLEVEVFRDAVMTVAGKLKRSPPTEQFLDRWNQYEHDRLTDSKPFVTPADIEHEYRSVYLPVLRGTLPEVFSLFDFADPNRVVGQREESTLPAQALFLMNSPWIIERASWAAERLLSESSLTDRQLIDKLFELALSRPPTDDERSDALNYLAQKPDERPADANETLSSEQTRMERWASYCQLIFASSEFRYLQ